MSPMRAFLHILAAGLVACGAFLLLLRPFVPALVPQVVAASGFGILLGLLLHGLAEREHAQVRSFTVASDEGE